MASNPSNALTTERTPDGSLKIVVSGQAQRLWPLFLCLLLGGPIAAGFGLWLLIHPIDEHIQFIKGPVMLMFMGLLGMALGACGFALQLANGKPKDATFTVRRGTIHLDHYISGDHVTRTYSENEVFGLFFDSMGVHAITGLDRLCLLQCMRESISRELARLIANEFWGQDNTREFRQQIVGAEQHCYAPRSPVT